MLALVAWSNKDRLGAALKGRPSGAPSSAAAPSGSAKAPAAPVVADGITVAPRRVAASATTNGTLLAAEQVDLVPEVSRRLIRVAVKDGASVKKGDTLFVLDSADLAAQSATLAVRRKLAIENEKRARLLAAEGLTTAQEIDRLAAERALAEAQGAELAVQLSRTVLRAPFGGRVGLVRVSEGAWVSPATILATLQSLEQVRVDFALPERYAPQLRPGLAFTFRMPSRGGAYEGRIVALEPRIDDATRSVVVRGVADNDKGDLLPGSFVAVALELSVNDAGVVVPSEAILPIPGGHAVFVAKDGVAKQVDVKLGTRTERDVEIVEGVAQGDVVLVTNLLRLRDGARVEVRPRAMEAQP